MVEPKNFKEFLGRCDITVMEYSQVVSVIPPAILAKMDREMEDLLKAETQVVHKIMKFVEYHISDYVTADIRMRGDLAGAIEQHLTKL